MLYVATARVAFVAVGLGLFLAGSVAVYQGTPHVRERVANWLHPWTTTKVFCPLSGQLAFRQDCQSYQEVQSLYSIAHGGDRRHRPRHRHVHDRVGAARSSRTSTPTSSTPRSRRSSG